MNTETSFQQHLSHVGSPDRSSPKRKQKHLLRHLPALSIFILFTLLHFNNLRHLPTLSYWLNNRIFYADTRNTYSGMKEISIDQDSRKHPLFAVITQVSVAGAKTLHIADTKNIIHGLLAIVAGLNITLFFFLLKKHTHKEITALLWTIFYGTSFANLVFFGIPETYSLTALGITAFLICLPDDQDNLDIKNIIMLGIPAGIGALLNPPLIFLLASAYCLALMKLPFKKFMLSSFLASILALFIFFGLNLLLFGTDYMNFGVGYAKKWASFSNLIHPIEYVKVFTSFFIYGIITPLHKLSSSIGLNDFTGYFSTPLKLPFAATFIGFTIYAGWNIVRKIIKDPLVLSLLAWLGIVCLFYVYFNPRESFLYATQVLGPFMILLMKEFDILEWRWKNIAFAVFVTGTAYFNIACFYDR